MVDIVDSWQLEGEIATKIKEIIRDNAIDNDSMSKLTPDLIKEMFPKIGLRLHFFEKWKATYGQRNNPQSNQDTDTESVDSSLNVTASNPQNSDDHALIRKDAFIGENCLLIPKIRELNIKSLLDKTIQGQAILCAYKKTRSLSRKCRNVIVDLILSETLSKTPRLRNQDLEYLAREIVRVFPTETTYSYYIPPVAKRFSQTQKSVISRGKLVDKYRNKIREFKHLTSFEVKESPGISNSQESDEDAETITEATLWLGKHTEPWAIVNEKWKLTADVRRKHNDSQQATKIFEIFERWPILSHPKGYTLIEVDYDFLDLSPVQLNVENWSCLFANIQNIRSPRKDDSNANALNKLLQLDHLDDDSKVVLQLLMLPHLIPPKGRLIINKRQWKPSISECKDSMIRHTMLPGDITKIQEDRREAMRKLALTVQPFIIAVGPNLTELSSFYVCIDKVLYQVPSAIKAIDICFKSFHALHAAYPPESEHLWLLLQRSLFGFTTKWDNIIPSVMEIITEISNLNKENVEKRT